jgi:hypothetical protein
LLGRKVTFLTGLLGFAGVSAIGGASVNFAMLVTARARLPKAKVYAVTTHCLSTVVKCRAPCADGSAMFITVRSRTTMSCARPITPRMSQRRRSSALRDPARA